VSRIIAGVAGGRRLRMPAGATTRPTADRAREGLFSTVTSLCGDVGELSFLDLYAGSGAVGLEAASRGARRVDLVERDPAALRVLRANVDTLALPGVQVHPIAVERFLERPAGSSLDTASGSGFDIVFLDPPYAERVEAVLASLAAGAWLSADAVVCVERASRDADIAWPGGLEPLRTRRYGESTLCYGRRS
jgi:16S rRNA (guanine966-N2)-methyltransferase